MTTGSSSDARPLGDRQHAMRLSLGVGVLMLLGKVGAYLLTGSAAILSDAAESVIHVVAVAFAAFSLSLSVRPADSRFPYGYERISFFSAGFEGAMIILAAIWIIVTAVQKWLGGLELERLGLGTALVAAAALLNGGLGWYLITVGRRTNSIILIANGKHVLTDSWTSFGVVVGLILVLWTGWKRFDPIVAIAVALNILWSGGALIRRSVAGLMDYSDPAVATAISSQMDEITRDLGIGFHHLRFRDTGQRTLIEVHLLFNYGTQLGKAHGLATAVEERLATSLPFECEIVTHLEAVEDHAAVHRVGAH
jgi:cation diffusion facilitator family transporter